MSHTKDSQFADSPQETLYDIWDTLVHKLLVAVLGVWVDDDASVVLMAVVGVLVVVVESKLLQEY
jgi:hypothetical protein